MQHASPRDFDLRYGWQRADGADRGLDPPEIFLRRIRRRHAWQGFSHLTIDLARNERGAADLEAMLQRPGKRGAIGAREGFAISAGSRDLWFGLRGAVVVPVPFGDLDVCELIGAAASQYISEHLPPAGTLGITWGGTIRAAAQNIRRRSGDGSRVVLLYGGLAERTAISPYDKAAMARALGARCYYVTAPMFAHTEELCSARVSSKPVRSVLAMAAELDIALLTAVDLSEQSKALEYGVISRETWQSLLDAGAVGDICGQYLDIDGRAVAHPLTNRVIHPKMKSLLQVPERVLAAGGLQKIPIIGAAIRARLVDILVTDEQAAIGLLG